jgi:hypothetical protein
MIAPKAKPRAQMAKKAAAARAGHAGSGPLSTFSSARATARRLGVGSTVGGSADSMTLLSPGAAKRGILERVDGWRLAPPLPTC